MKLQILRWWWCWCCYQLINIPNNKPIIADISSSNFFLQLPLQLRLQNDCIGFGIAFLRSEMRRGRRTWLGFLVLNSLPLLDQFSPFCYCFMVTEYGSPELSPATVPKSCCASSRRRESIPPTLTLSLFLWRILYTTSRYRRWRIRARSGGVFPSILTSRIWPLFLHFLDLVYPWESRHREVERRSGSGGRGGTEEEGICRRSRA